MNLKSPLWRRCFLHLRWYFLHLVRVSLFQLHRLITIILDNFSRLPFTNGPKCHKCIKCNLHVSTGQQNRLVSPNISKNKERSRIQPPKKKMTFTNNLVLRCFCKKWLFHLKNWEKSETIFSLEKSYHTSSKWWKSQFR